MKVTTNTREYQFSHGRKPRGHGFWMFRISGLLYQGTGSYTEIKAEAVRRAKLIHQSVSMEVIVLP